MSTGTKIAVNETFANVNLQLNMILHKYTFHLDGILIKLTILHNPTEIYIIMFVSKHSSNKGKLINFYSYF